MAPPSYVVFCEFVLHFMEPTGGDYGDVQAMKEEFLRNQMDQCSLPEVLEGVIIYPSEGLLFQRGDEELYLEKLHGEMHPDLVIFPKTMVTAQPTMARAFLKAYQAFKLAQSIENKVTPTGKRIMRIFSRDLPFSRGGTISEYLDHFKVQNIDRVYKVRYSSDINFELAGRIVTSDPRVKSYYFFIFMDGESDYEYNWEVNAGFIYIETSPNIYCFTLYNEIELLTENMRGEIDSHVPTSIVKLCGHIFGQIIRAMYDKSSMTYDFLYEGKLQEDFAHFPKVLNVLHGLRDVRIAIIGEDESNFWRMSRINILCGEIDRVFWIDAFEDRYEAYIRKIVRVPNSAGHTYIYINLIMYSRMGEVFSGANLYISRFPNLFFAVTAQERDGKFWKALREKHWICEKTIQKIMMSSTYEKARDVYKMSRDVILKNKVEMEA